MYKNIQDICQEFINFFKNKNHQIIDSSSLVPNQDKTLLFTNSGMNQFKNIFLGIDKPLYKRIATVQRCVRAGGKHNDLENVGYTERHLTFFEMLGNFSFGDYFKYDAIQFAWELLTSSHWFNLSKDKILVTVHVDDNESYNIWNKQIGISDQRIIKIGNKGNKDFSRSDNFWKMGSIGPCGPCSEIFYDRGMNVPGFVPGNFKEYGERYIEIWNLVFIQFDRQINGDLLLLPMLSVDTGMGLERIASVLQGVHSNYAIDIFKCLIAFICDVLQINDVNRSVYVIADHIRTCAFLIRDGVIPANEGRGYVLRRIIRRAILHGKKLGINAIFFYKLVDPLIKSMCHISDLLRTEKDCIEEILFNEEKLFARTLSKGLELLEKELSLLFPGDILNGIVAFNLYNTYGFPLELTKDICYERNIKVDQIKFDKAMLEQKNYTKQVNQFHTSYNHCMLFNDISSIFVGYEKLESQSLIIKLLQDNNSVDMLSAKEHGIVVLDKTPFYAESGGQIGDSGHLKTESGGSFKVICTKKYGKIIEHVGMMYDGILRVGDLVIAAVDKYKRKRICLNHSAHHLLRVALFNILGKHVVQRGSFINDKQLRFDFSHYQVMTLEQIEAVENFVNKNIWDNLFVTIDIMSMQKAKDSGAVMLSDKNYSDIRSLRVVNIGDISIELCGGTHVNNTGEIGAFIITKESSVSSRIRRIEGITGEVAFYFFQKQKKLISNISKIVCSNEKNLLNRVHIFKSDFYKLKKELEYLRNEQALQKSVSLMKDIFLIKNIQILMKEFINTELKMLFNMMDYLKTVLDVGLIIFISYNDKNNKVHLIVGVTKNLIKDYHINALHIIHSIINIFGGKGGGRSDFAQAGINEIKEISILISTINFLLRSML